MPHVMLVCRNLSSGVPVTGEHHTSVFTDRPRAKISISLPYTVSLDSDPISDEAKPIRSELAGRDPVLSTPQCSSGTNQSRRHSARSVKIMESAGHMTSGVLVSSAGTPLFFPALLDTSHHGKGSAVSLPPGSPADSCVTNNTPTRAQVLQGDSALPPSPQRMPQAQPSGGTTVPRSSFLPLYR